MKRLLLLLGLGALAVAVYRILAHEDCPIRMSNEGSPMVACHEGSPQILGHEDSPMRAAAGRSPEIVGHEDCPI